MAEQTKAVAQGPKASAPAPTGQEKAPQAAPRAALTVSGGKLRLQVQQSQTGNGGVAIGLSIDDSQGNQLVGWDFDGQDTNFSIEIPFQDLTLGMVSTQ